ncbi:MAG: exopolyphosphatase, partial [Acidimicrobiales bacterium]
LAVLALGLESFDEQQVHHAQLTRKQVSAFTDELAALPLSERIERRGMEKARADVIVGGAIVLGSVMDVFGFSELIASESDILDGIAMELIRTG